MIFDHVGIPANDVKRSKDFFCKALAPLGIGIVMESSDAVGLGKDKKPSLWVGEHKDRPLPLHIAFVAESRAQVRSFYQAALAAGASDNGPPGIREHYHPSLLRGICHRPGWTQYRGGLP